MREYYSRSTVCLWLRVYTLPFTCNQLDFLFISNDDLDSDVLKILTFNQELINILFEESSFPAILGFTHMADRII